MPIEAKDLLTYAGIDPEKFENIDAAKAAFDESFIKKDGIKDLLIKQPELADPIIGKRMNIIERKAFSLLEEAGLETDEFKGKKIEEVFDTALPKFKEHLGKLKQSDDGKVKELNEQLEKYKNSLKDTKSLLDTTKTEFDQYKTNVVQEKRTAKIDDYFNQAYGTIDFSPEADEVKKIGFKAIVKEKYKIELDEQEKPIVVDAKTNERIKDPNKHGQFMELGDLLKLEAEKTGVLRKNPHSGKPAGVQFGTGQQFAPPAENQKPKRLLNRY